jgi:RNA polymerase sigma factor (sigma-70 family)
MMDERDWLAERFEEHRSHLRAVAYRMLGSVSEADEAVQEAWLPLSRTDTSSIKNLGGWLTQVVARVCLDMLRTRKSRREESLDAHLPGPLASRPAEDDPEQEALIGDSVGLALLVVLERLAPAERLAFVLHDMFAVPFDEIAPIVDRSPAAPAAASMAWAGGQPRTGRAGLLLRGPPTSPENDRWSRPSGPPRAAAISKHPLPCSIPTSSCLRTAQARRGRFAARQRSRAGRAPVAH